MTLKQHIILGFPNSGKTTFLAAFWHILDAGEVTSLTLEKTSGDVRYLNEIKNIWLKCEQVPRTLTSSEEMVEILVRDTKTGQATALRLPDFSGETFQSLFANRECDQEFLETLDRSSGILFFINADRANDMMAVTDHNFPDDEDEAARDAEHLEDFDPRQVPEQSRIVDVLQLLQMSPFRNTRRRLAIAISAWDVVCSDGISPEQWIAREMPMLAQYLVNNADAYDVCFCGISAQGGCFEGGSREQLLEKKPADRVLCVWEEEDGHDITQPLTWLSENDA